MEPTHEMPMVSADPDPEGLLEPAAGEPSRPETTAAEPTRSVRAQPEREDEAQADPSPQSGFGAWSDAQKALFALMAMAIFVLLIGLAANAESTEPSPQRQPEPRCWAFDDDCCIAEYGWDDCCDWYEVDDNNDGRGLFDAEEHFADDPPSRLRCR